MCRALLWMAGGAGRGLKTLPLTGLHQAYGLHLQGTCSATGCSYAPASTKEEHLGA